MFTFIVICQSCACYIMSSTDTPSNVSVAFNDQVKPVKSTHPDERIAVNEDAGPYGRPLDVGKRYVVRRLDGSLRESFS